MALYLPLLYRQKNMGAYHLHKTGGGAVVHKIKTITFDEVGKRSTTKYIQMS